MTNSISTRLIIFTLSALLAFAVAEREFNLCAREEKVQFSFRSNQNFVSHKKWSFSSFGGNRERGGFMHGGQ